MSLSTQEMHDVAAQLLEAEKTRKTIPPLTNTYPNITLENAYQIQLLNVNQCLKTGRRLMGYKVGLTSRAAQQHFGVSHPDFGHLFTPMAIPDEGELMLDELIQPKIEGEIALVLGRDLRGPGVTVVDALGAVDYALGSMEIIDSRIENWKIKTADTIADNGSSARFVLSQRKQPIQGLDLAELGMAFSRNGEVLLTGAGSAVMGNPLNAIVFLANELGKMDRGLFAGEVVLSGALSGVVSLQRGDFFSCEIGKLGSCSVRVK